VDKISESGRTMGSDKNRDHEETEEMGLHQTNSTTLQQPPNGAAVNESAKERSSASTENREVKKKEKTKKKKEDLKKSLEKKEEELRQKHDCLLRNQAEFENFKKRTAREKLDLLKFGNESLMRELLPVIDNFERSLAHAKDAPSIDDIISGIDLIKKDFMGKLEKFGLKAIPAQGEPFDPLKHEATLQIETSEHTENTVVAELQKGYCIHDRLLRPAMVTVAKAPSTPHNESSDSEE